MEELQIDFSKYENSLERENLTRDVGKISEVTGFLLKGYLPGASVGSVVEIFPGHRPSFFAEVVGFKDNHVLFMPLGEMNGVGLGAKVILVKREAEVKVGPSLLGRVINGLGEPIDGKGPIESHDERSIYNGTVNPLSRPTIAEPLDMGVRAINGFITMGKGQRVGIMAGSGVGKSVLLGMMARSSNADINVIALIGERGREVREFIEKDLGEEGLKKSVVVVATSDQSPLVRMRGAFLATTLAEYFSDLNNDVLLMMDSVTRFAMAQREVGLNLGEPPTSKGYTPSVFSLLPKLLERAGSFENKGSITGIYTVLVEGDDMDEPVTDSVRSIVDGHIVLSRKLAQKGHFPAIDVLQSASRVMRAVTDENHQDFAITLRECLAVYKEAEDLINIGAYQEGANPKIDVAIRVHDAIISLLRQKHSESGDLGETLTQMQQIVGHC